MNLSKQQSFFLLHFIIIIWGFTGILGKLIAMPSEIIVWNRMTIAFICLLIINLLSKNNHNITTHGYIQYIFIGFLIAIHWICFFESIKLSTVSLALVCLSSISLFTAILEPIIQKKKIRIYELLLSLLVITGIVVIHSYEANYSYAIFLSIISAFFGALFTVFNHTLIQNNHKAISMTAWEMFGGALALTIYLVLTQQFNYTIIPNEDDMFYIIILGTICTAFAFSASTEVMKKLSPFTVNLSVNLEPIYTIIIALIIFGDNEKMSVEFYIGAMIILTSVIMNSIIKKYYTKLD